jgi:hypothetical protein
MPEDLDVVTTPAMLVILIEQLRKHFDGWRKPDGRPTDARVLAHLLAPKANINGVRDSDHAWGFPVVSWGDLPDGWPDLSGDPKNALRRLLAWAEGKVSKPLDRAASASETTSEVAGPWSRPKGPKEWAKVFGFSPDTFKRRCASGAIRYKKLSSRKYLVHLDDIPTSISTQAKSAQVGVSPHK